MSVALIAGILLSTIASFFFSGIETGIYSLNRVRLRLRASEGDARAVRLRGLVRRPQILISSILIGNHVANYAASYFGMGLLVSVLGVGDPVLLNLLFLTPFLFVFGELTPKNVFRIQAEVLVYRASGILALATLLFYPIALALRWFGRLTRALPRKPPALDAILSRDRLGSLVRDVTEEGVLTEEQSRMVGNVMRISSIPVRDAMISLSEVDTVVEGFTRDQLVSASRKNRRTRIPVVSRADGRPVGVVNVLDLVFQDDKGLETLVHPVPSIPSHEVVDRALRTLVKARQLLGFVTERGEEIVGIVTVKDLVEEVSGELPVF
jgi:CBS domain containing-hemolysin-like protein